MRQRWFKPTAVFLIALLIFSIISLLLLKPKPDDFPEGKLTFNVFTEKLNQPGEITSLIIEENNDKTSGTVVEVTTKDGKRREVNFPLYLHPGLAEKLESSSDINIVVKQVSSSSWTMLLWLVGPLILVFIFYRLSKKQQKEQENSIKSFTKKRGNPAAGRKNERFSDVAGIDEVKEELEDVVDFLRNPAKYLKLGARIPRGVLLAGAPGTGKTLLARAIAGEADVPFFSASASEFVEMFVGVGAARVRDLFNEARAHAPAIVFIDEIDAVGRHRGAGLGQGHDEREQTLNQIFVEMDGFDERTNIIVIAATNRPDILDPALLRPKRFDRIVTVNKPDVKGREAILRVHTKDKPLAEDVNLGKIAKSLPGATGADLENVINEAAITAAKTGESVIHNSHFLAAIDKILLGKEKKLVMDEEDKKLAAFHEAGHTVVSKMLPGTDPIRKVSIVARGSSLGQTLPMPEKDRYVISEQYLLNHVRIDLGGRVAEEVFLNTKSTGAEDDLRRASDLVQKMVCHYGMSSLGPRTFGVKQAEIFLGREVTRTESVSPESLREIDEEVGRIISEAYQDARALLSSEEGRRKVKALVNALLEKETLPQEEIDSLLA